MCPDGQRRLTPTIFMPKVGVEVWLAEERRLIGSDERISPKPRNSSPDQPRWTQRSTLVRY